jgi:hypothetical protein
MDETNAGALLTGQRGNDNGYVVIGKVVDSKIEQEASHATEKISITLKLAPR